MRKERGSALEGFAALYDGTGNSESTVAERITTKCVIETELVELCQAHGDKPHKGTPLGKLAELWPFDALKRPLLEHAREFVRQVGLQGYQPVTNVEQFTLFGPYMEKVGDIRPWVPEAGNHVIPKHEQRTAQKVWGYQGDEFDWDKGCAFLIQGKFTIAAKHGFVSDEGHIYV